MKVEAISLALIATLAVAAAIPLGGGAVSMEREERARKDSAKLRLEHRGVEELVQAIRKTAGDGEVVEASDVVSANAGEKSVAQAQPTGIATAGQGGVAVSSPQAVAVVGPGGLAISKPVAVAVAGPGADKPGIFLRPEAGQGPSDGTEEASTEDPPEVEEASEEGGDVTPPPQAMFHYLVYPQAMLVAPQHFYPGLV